MDLNILYSDQLEKHYQFSSIKSIKVSETVQKHKELAKIECMITAPSISMVVIFH